MTTAVTQADIARYVEQVRAALADLPEAERDDLLEDLPDHLAEVAADGDGSLTERLGPPAAYAAELRASAGIATARRETLATVVGEARRRLRQVDTKVGPMLGYEKASAFLRLLRPAWWVLRGYLAALAVVYVVDSGPVRTGLLPRFGGGDVLGVLTLFAFVVGSIWLGRREARLSEWPRRAVWAGGVLAVVIGFWGIALIDERSRFGDFDAVNYSDPYRHIDDVYVYDEHGNLLTGVRLFDQNGQPIQLGGAWCAKGRGGVLRGQTISPPFPVVVDPMALPYPRCPEHAPFAVHPTATAPPPSPGASPEPTAAPQPSATG